MHLVYIHDTSAWFGRFVLSTLVRPFSIIHNGCLCLWAENLSGPLKINVLFLTLLYLSVQGRFCFPIASSR